MVASVKIVRVEMVRVKTARVKITRVKIVRFETTCKRFSLPGPSPLRSPAAGLLDFLR